MHSRFILFRLIKRQTTGSGLGYFGIGLIAAARKTDASGLLIDALAGPAGEIRQDGLALFTQPCATGSCHLKVLPDD